MKHERNSGQILLFLQIFIKRFLGDYFNAIKWRKLDSKRGDVIEAFKIV